MKNHKSLINSIDKLFDYYARLLVLRSDAFMDRKLIIPFYAEREIYEYWKIKKDRKGLFPYGC